MKNSSIKRTSLFAMSLFVAGAAAILPVSALEILANNYSMNATTEAMTAQQLCETAKLVSTDPTEGVTWTCSSANLDTTKAGRYSINVKATDEEGQSETKTIVVIVKGVKAENTAPVLKLTQKEVTINKGDSINLRAYIESATDAEDGNLLGRVTISGEVDVNKPGTYTISYRVYDNEGLEDIQTLTVKVIDGGVGGSSDATTDSGNAGTTGSENGGSTTTPAETPSEGSNAGNTNSGSAPKDEGETLPQTGDTSAMTIAGAAILAIGGAAVVARKRKEYEA